MGASITIHEHWFSIYLMNRITQFLVFLFQIPRNFTPKNSYYVIYMYPNYYFIGAVQSHDKLTNEINSQTAGVTTLHHVMILLVWRVGVWKALCDSYNNLELDLMSWSNNSLYGIVVLAAGLMHLKNYGFAHRDIKPGNIMKCRHPDGT